MTSVQLYTGDCLDVLKTINSGTVDLVYLDPPFFTQKVHKLSSRDGNRSYSFEDLWASHSEYVQFILDRVTEMRRCLKTSGSIFFQCNDRSSHLARFVLDEVFGEQMFRSEIIWAYRRWSNTQKGLLPAHQTIWFYSKSSTFKFNHLTTDYSASTNLDQILQKRRRDDRGKAIYARDHAGQIISNGGKKGVPLSDVWEIPYLNPKAKERVGYPTQKPILLLDRILSLVTESGDVVLDPFCGSGTTLVTAQLRGCPAIGIDSSAEAINLAKERLKEPTTTRSRLLERGREGYIRDDMNLLELLNGIEFFPVQRNRGIDAVLKEEYEGRPVLIRIQRHGEPLSDAINALLQAATKKGRPQLVVIATNDMQQHLVEQRLWADDVIVVPSTANALKSALQESIKGTKASVLHPVSAVFSN